MFWSVRIMLAGGCLFFGLLVASSTQGAEAAKVQAVLQKHCYQCHGQKGAIEGGINYILSAERLVGRGKVTPGKPAASALLQRIKSGEMPPKGAASRPSDSEVALIEAWITDGAKSFGDPAASREVITEKYILKYIHQDLEKTPKRQRRFIRYFSIANLYNSGFSNDELLTYRRGLSKLINSLSWNPKISIFKPVDPAKTVLRIDLRSYNWTAEIWEKIATLYPYAVTFEDDSSKQVHEWAECDVPCVRADWFVANAAVPPLYHEILKLPKSDVELERLLHVNVKANIEQETVLRAGFNSSGISRNNRLVERHESPYGAYWKSYDFTGGKGRQNLFAYPIGPDAEEENSFKHAGGEILFNLPNGLQAYLLVDADGNRIDKAPLSVVSDSGRPDRTVVNGISCMSCHHNGMIDKADQVRPFVESNPKAFSEDDRGLILALYKPHKEFQRAIKEDTKRFRDAVTRTGGLKSQSEPIVALMRQFEAELDLAIAAADTCLTTEQLAEGIRNSRLLSRKLGALNVPGGSVQRDVFNEAFRDIVRELEIGETQNRVGELRRYEGHTGRVPILAFSPDGTQLLTGGDDQFVRLWDVKSGQSITRFTKHSHKLRAIAFRKDGLQAATGTEDGMINLWDLKEGKFLRSFLGHKDKVYHLKYSANGKWLMSSGMDALIKRWNLDAPTAEATEYRGHRSWVRSFDVSPNGDWFVSTGNDASILQWRTDSTRPLKRVAWAHKAPLSTIRLVPNSRFALTAGFDNQIKIFDLTVMRAMRTFNSHTGPVVALDVSPDGRRFATVSDDKTLRIWSVALLKELMHFESPSKLASVAFSPDGTRVATGDHGGVVQLWGLPSLSDEEQEEQLPNSQDAGPQPPPRIAVTEFTSVTPLGVNAQPKWTVIPSKEGTRISGFRFKSNLQTESDLVLAFVAPAVPFGWRIISADSAPIQNFKGFARVQNAAFNGIITPDKNSVILQHHVGGHIKPGKEYVIWFDFKNETPPPFHAMVKLFPVSERLDGRRQFVQSGQAVARHLGLKWPFQAKAIRNE